MSETVFSTAIPRTVGAKTGEHPSVLDFGAKADGVRFDDAVIVASSTTLSALTSLPFVAAHVGRRIRIDGAGASGAILRATIVTVTDSGSAIISAAASTTVPAAYALIDSSVDNTAAFNNAIADIRIRSERGGCVFVPPGVYTANSPIFGAAGVTLLGAHCGTRYGLSSTRPYLPSCIAAGVDFVVDQPLIDFRQMDQTGLFNLEIVGDGSASYNKTDATSRGVLLGSAELGTTIEAFGCVIEQCSIVNHHRSIYAKVIGALKFRNNNITAWKTGIKLEEYAGNDGQFFGNNINSCWWENNPADVTGDDSGVGLDLGLGCALMNWVGGKIEWNSVGVRLGPGSFGVTFTGVTFDANARHSVQVHGQSDTDNIWTEGHTFNGCFFGGGSYAAQTASQSLDCHALINCAKSTGAPVPTQVTFNNCQFKATQASTSGVGIYWQRSNNSGNYPKGAAIRVIETGTGNSGFPVLNLVGNDFRHSNVQSGTITCAGTPNVTWASGDQFEAAWAGLPIWIFWFDEFKIASITDATHLVMNDNGPTGTFDYRVEPNKIAIAASLSTHMHIRALGNIGVPDFQKQPRADGRDISVVYRSDDATFDPALATFRFEETGNLTTRGYVLARNGLRVGSDAAAGVFIGRQDSGGAAVVDAYATDGGTQPTSLVMKVAGAIKGIFSALGLRVDTIGVGTAANTTYPLDVSGAGRVTGALNFPAITTNRFLYVDGSSFVVPQKIKPQDGNHMDATGMGTDLLFARRNGAIIETAKIALNNNALVTLGGPADGVVLAAVGDAISSYTLTGLANNLDYHDIGGGLAARLDAVDAAIAANTAAIATKSDTGHGHSGGSTGGASAGTPHTHGGVTV